MVAECYSLPLLDYSYNFMHQGHKISEPADVYCLLRDNLESVDKNEKIKLPVKHMSEESNVPRQYFSTKLHRSFPNGKFSAHFSVHEIQKISRSLKRMLQEYVTHLLNISFSYN